MSATDAFVHEALFYSGDDDLVARLVPFLRDGVTDAEPTLVVLPAHKNAMLRDALGDAADAITFADMNHVGRNPGRIIPAWREFVDAHASSGRSLRGVGEPIDPHRQGTELTECHRHEALLNVEFADDSPLWLLCPYDVETLDPGVVADARRTHPILRGRSSSPSVDYTPIDLDEPFAAPLHEPEGPVLELEFGADHLREVRTFAMSAAEAFALDSARRVDLVLAVNEMATNSLRHGGGTGRLRAWVESNTLICEVRDGGVLREALVGRRTPSPDNDTGRGHWMANQVCDLVQLHSSDTGTTVRLHMRLTS